MKVRGIVSLAAAGLLSVCLSAASYAGEEAAAKVSGKEAAPASYDPSVAATVNGSKITVDMLDKILQQAPQGMGQEGPEAKRALLDKLVEVEMVAQEAEKDGIDKDPEFAFAMEMLKKQQLYVALMKKEVIDTAKVSPEEVKAHYDANKSQFVSGEEVQASHILVDTEEEAKEAKARLDKGEDFAAVAKEKSKCPSAQRGGDLGYFGAGRMVPEFEKAAFALKAGEVSAPVKTQFGWHVIKLTGRKEAKGKELGEVKEQIEQQLMQEKQRKAYDDLMARLRAASDIKINETALAPKAKETPEASPEGADKGEGEKATEKQETK